jgi:glycosyltransferase involved in cell wall biosynthesis
MTNNREPLVSIGMTVRNQEMFVESAIASLLNQKYQNFELIISDNASDDRSPEICQHFARKDKRIHYIQNRENLGPNANMVNVLNAISGEFYMFASGHDLYHRNFISSLVEQYNRNDNKIVLAYADTVRIDRHGKRICNVIEDVDTRNLSLVEGFKKIVWGLSWCTPIYGLHRTSTFKSTWKMYEITGPDKILLPELGLKGVFVRHPEILFYMRKNRPAENHIQMIRRQIKWFVHNKFETLMPSIMRNHELLKAVHASNLDNSEKEELVEEILRWLHADPHKHTKKEMRNLLRHGMEMLNSNEISHEEKVFAADEYLRITRIGRFFRPEMGAQIDQLCWLCHKIRKDC